MLNIPSQWKMYIFVGRCNKYVNIFIRACFNWNTYVRHLPYIDLRPTRVTLLAVNRIILVKFLWFHPRVLQVVLLPDPLIINNYQLSYQLLVSVTQFSSSIQISLTYYRARVISWWFV